MWIYLLACTTEPTQRVGKTPIDTSLPADSETQDSPHHDSNHDSPPQDQDQDGSPLPEDCNDADPNISPETPEICDGQDQDCDGIADNDVPNDGAGCQDPGMPLAADTVQRLQFAVLTDTSIYAATDSPSEFCVNANDCYTTDIADWDNCVLGAMDIVTVENLSLPRSSIENLTLHSLDGDDQWVVSAASLSIDGLPGYCGSNLDLKIGSAGSGELMTWTVPLASDCESIWGSPLTHGPLLGAVDADGARIWYRSDLTRPVKLRVASTASALANAPVVHYGYPAIENDFTETVHVQGLSPESTYYYDLEIDGERFGPWSFQTAPAPDTQTRLKIAFGSCAYVPDQPVFGALTAYQPDVFLFVGDNHYGNTADLDAQRQNYRQVYNIPLRRDFLHQASILTTWDDHDYAGDNLDGNAAGKEDALRVFTEYTANASYGITGTPGVFTSQRYGPIEFFMIDDRYYRGLEGDMLGSAQETWLMNALAQSDATFKFLVSGSQWTLQGTGDSWAEFPEAQQRLIAALATIPGVVFLSGDVHHDEMRLLPGVGYDIPELTSSPLARDSIGSCPGDSEILYCYAEDSYIGMEIDTTLPDPTLEATIYNTSNVPQATWLIHRSELE